MKKRKAMHEPKISLIRLPSFFRKQQFSSKLNYCLIPPLGMGLITGYLRAHGISLEQDDLNIKIHYDNYYAVTKGNAIDMEVFFDAERIVRYTEGHQDADIDLLMEKAISKTKLLKNQILLLSLPDNIENESNLMFALAFTKFVKEKYNCIQVVGGEALWLDLLRNKYKCRHIDYMIYGEGEIPVYQLLLSLTTGKQLDAIPGLEVFEAGKIIRSSIASKLISPDFSGLPMEYYMSQEEVLSYPEDLQPVMREFQLSKTLILPYRFIRGCPYECAFCVSSVKQVTDVLSPQEVVHHLKCLQERYRPTGFFFLNDTINISHDYVNMLCDEIIKQNLKILWSDCARADNLDRDTIFKMRNAGCIRLIFGMESASPRILKYINKRIELTQLQNVLRWADEAGIWTGVEVICGLPHESDEDIAATVNFLKQNSECINRVYLNHFDLRENTPFYNQPDRFGIKRIFDVHQYAEKDFISYVRFGFDEQEGLAWPDKQKQIERSLKKVLKECAQGVRYFTDEHFLFYLYSTSRDKEDIWHMYQKIVKN
ncbi:MAG: B12-binding domain-containing radical SAM protein [Candidatus Omnitrophota bacterium]